MQNSPMPAMAPAYRRPRQAIGGALLAGGLAVAAAWPLQAELLRAAVPYVGTMVFATALCLALLGAALLLLDAAAPWWRRAGAAAGLTVAGIAALALFEHATGGSTGVALPHWHRGLQADAAAPGRMAVSTAYALLLLGLAAGAWPHAARRGVGATIQALVLVALPFPVFGLVIRELQIDFLYSPALFSGMAVHTALGLIAACAGFWLAWQGAPWNRMLRFDTDERRIASFGTLVLLAVALGAGGVGLHAASDTLEQTIAANQAQSLRARATLVATTLDHRLTHAQAIASRPEIMADLRAYGTGRDRSRHLARLAAAAESWLPLDFSGVAFYASTGGPLASTGRFVDAPEQQIALNTRNAAQLLWRNGYHLRVKIAIYDRSGRVGWVLAEQFLPHLTEALIDMQDFSRSGEIELCGREGSQAACFPTRLNSRPYVYPPAVLRQPQPIYRALAGGSGSGYARDYRNTRVFASHAPVADYGLAMVLKIGVDEIKQPIRRELELALPAVLLVLATGIVLLRLLAHPLALRLARREQQLQLALDASGLALWDYDARRNLIYLDAHWGAIIGGRPEATMLRLQDLARLVHPDDFERIDAHLKEVLKGRLPAYDVEFRVRTADGRWKWIHSQGKVIARDRHGRALRLTGTNADVDARKTAELQLAHQARHDALTGLPNRSLFQDRLAQAMARSRRDREWMAVLYMDIDRFKHINDSLGHAAGDALLKGYAGRLADCVRATDTVARLGGDEFAVVLERLSCLEDGHRIAAKIVAAMRPAFEHHGDALSVTTSVGMAFYRGEPGVDASALVQRADAALYAAKAAGRDNYRVAETFTPDGPAAA